MQNKLYQYRPAIELVADVVNELNDSLNEYDDLLYGVSLVVYDVHTYDVKFLDWAIYSTDCEQREHDGATDTYEPLDIYLRRVINEKLKALGQIKI